MQIRPMGKSNDHRDTRSGRCRRIRQTQFNGPNALDHLTQKGILMPAPASRRLLLIGWSAYIVGFILHSIAHIYMWSHTPVAVLIMGALADVVGIGILIIILRRHPLAANALALFGAAVAIGLILIHIPVYWGPFSQPWHFGEMALPYWLSLAAAVAGGLTASAIGLYVGRLTSNRSQRNGHSWISQ